MEEVKKALKDKDKEVQDLKDQLRQAKEVAIRLLEDPSVWMLHYAVISTPLPSN